MDQDLQKTQPEVKVKPPIEDADVQLHSFVDFRSLLSFVGVGLAIFFLSGLAIIVVIFLFVPMSSIDNVEVLKSVEMLLRLGATAAILAILIHFKNTFVVVFGLFLIGALIVPRNDLIRLGLLATGSSQNYRNFFVQPSAQKQTSSRDEDVATSLIDSLDGLTRDADASLCNKPANLCVREFVVENRDIIKRTFARAVTNDRTRATYEQVVQRGTLPLLKIIDTDTTNGDKKGMNEFLYLYGATEKLEDDFNFLRSEGLITYPYDDIERATILKYGQSVVQVEQAAPPRAANETSALLPPITGRIPDDIQSRPVVELGKENTEVSKEVNFSRAEEFIRIKFLSNERIVVKTTTDRQLDPVVSVYSQNKDLIAFNDDALGPTLDSELSLQGEMGKEYYLGYASLRGVGSGQIRFAVESSGSEVQK